MQNKDHLRTMLKEAGILFAITLIAGLLLGVVYELTKEPIRIQQEKAIQEACAAAFSGSPDENGDVSNDEFMYQITEYIPDEQLTAELAADGVEVGDVYTVTGTGVTYGFVVEVTSKNGYGGNIVLYVGVSTDGTVKGVSILELSETAGLGMEAPKVLAPQFAGRNVESFAYTKTGAQADNEVDAITSATITTSAVVDAVNGGIRIAQYLRDNWPEVIVEIGGGANE